MESNSMTQSILKRMFTALIDGPLTKERYDEMYAEFSEGEEINVGEPSKVKLISKTGLVVIRQGSVSGEHVFA
jgi:hypothetical protein